MYARIGMPVHSADGAWGELDDLIVDPTNWHVTHLVLQPRHHHDRSHLVPVSSVAVCDDILVLTLSADEIDQAPQFEVTEFIKIERPDAFGNRWTTDTAGISAWPYYPYGGQLTGIGTGFGYRGYGSLHPLEPQYVATRFDRPPDHEVAIRRTSHVVSSDEHSVGTVDGFVFNDEGQITHLVLDHGHLWGHREVTIPIGHVRHADRDQVRLDATRHEIGEFRSVHFHRHA